MEENVLEQILEGNMKPTHLPLETLRKITDGFSIDRVIGEGGFGTVYKGDVGNMSVAVKRIRSNMTIDEKLFRREVDSLMEVDHPNVVRFLGLCSHTVETPIKSQESRGYIYAEIRERLLCFEYVSNGGLDAKITDELRGLEWESRYQIIRGICAGLHHLHMDKFVLHMDLKPANILLDKHMMPKITDFGLSRPLENSQTMTTNHFATPWYCAPENLFGGRMSFKSDIYSLGVIIIELVTGHKGIRDDSNNILRRWRHRWSKSAKETPPEYHQQVTGCIEIGSLCQKIDPYSRPSISEIMRKFLEMESMNNHIGNANESTVGQIIPPVSWEDDMLGVEPLELQFEYEKQKRILSCSILLSNDTDSFIAYKIQTASPLLYFIEPNNDIVKPRSKCRVDISLHVADTHDHEAARRYPDKQYTDFIVRSIKVNESLTAHDIFEDMFDKHSTGHCVDEIHLAVVSEDPSSKEVINLPSEEAKEEHASSGWTPIKPGSVQLVIKNNKRASLCKYKEKVMLELTGGDYTSDRPGLDLVAVLDVSHNSLRYRLKMDELKMAMRFVLQKLSPIDRLSIVTFSDEVRELCPLRQITEASQQELQELIDGLEVSDGVSSHSNIKDGLLTGHKVLADRKVSRGRVAGIMLMSNSPMSRSDLTRVTVDNVPVYTFGVGASRNPGVLSEIAAKSMGGTFSHVQDDVADGGLTMAFSQCLAGLLSVSVQDLELTVAAVGGESMIVKVTAGSYKQRKHQNGLVTVSLGELYSREVRNIIVDIFLPAVDRECSAEILKVTYSYTSRSSDGRLQFVAAPKAPTVWRTSVEVVSEETPAELQREEARLQTAKMIKDTTARILRNDQRLFIMLGEAQEMLMEAQNMVRCDPLLTTELEELFELYTRQTYSDKGLPYAASSESSHGRQRFAMRGSYVDAMRLFATPLMDKYLEQAKRFYQDPSRPLPSADDDVKEEVGAIMINADSREEEIRRLSLNTEN